MAFYRGLSKSRRVLVSEIIFRLNSIFLWDVFSVFKNSEVSLSFGLSRTLKTPKEKVIVSIGIGIRRSGNLVLEESENKDKILNLRDVY